MNREEQERLYNQKYGYQQLPDPKPPFTMWRCEGKPGAWEVICGIAVVERFTNRGHALTALRGYVNGRTNRRARYSWRKVYLYLQANGWRIELNEPPAVWWTHPGLGRRVKENRQSSPKALLVLCYIEMKPGSEKEILQAYWTWHKTHATT
jgi:hypothetical protein